MSKRKANSDWFKDAIIYELHIRAFGDSNEDGIGDFPGAIEKLDYLEDLGVNALWLLPFYPSPLKDDGYDVSNHTGIHVQYGTIADFKKFLSESHKRKIRVIIELILNHTSDQHPWFQRARKSRKGSKYRNYYVWSDSPEKYSDARVIFSDYESSNWSWDQEAKAYYWHRFYHHQPSLNYENSEVQLEMTKVLDFWLKLGVNGFRLSSVPFLHQKEGTTCENLPETHQFLKKLRSHIDKHHPQAILIAEANLWPEEAASYFGEGTECHMNFHYPLMPRLFMALHTENNYPIIDIMEQTPPAPKHSQWAIFLRNHDEMGLEMVTEEEKDYLYKAYASDPNTKHNIGIRRRLAPMLDNDRRKMELLYSLLFSLPGSPIIYYGDEIGMGDNVFLGDRHGVRTPMQWNANVNAGFSEANPQQLYLPIIRDPLYRHESINVKNQSTNSSSLLWWIKNTIGMRNKFLAFSRGEMEFLDTSNAKVLAFARSYKQQNIIVVANLSKYSQASTVNLKHYLNCELTEVFSRNRFPKVAQKKYQLTLAPYSYFWFYAEKTAVEEELDEREGLGYINAITPWEKFFTQYENADYLEKKILPRFMKRCRWFQGKAKVISRIKVDKFIPLKIEEQVYYFLLLEVSYIQRLPELYFLPVSFIPRDQVMEDFDYNPLSVISRIDLPNKSGFIIDSCYDKTFRDYLFYAISIKHKVKFNDGALVFSPGVFAKLDVDKNEIRSKVLKADQSNTAIIYNDKYFFKFYRKIEKEINPDLEIIRFLTEKTDFKNSPQFAGGIEFKDNDGGSIVFGLLQEMVENQGEAWSMTLDELDRYYERVIIKTTGNYSEPPLVEESLLTFEETPPLIQELIGKVFYDRVVVLARRTAEMHLALTSDKSDKYFTPDTIAPNYQRSVYSSMRQLLKDRFKLLQESMKKLPKNAQRLGEEILGLEKEILNCFSSIYKGKITGKKTRIHGDYHLGQVLFNGKDFYIIDFEGEPGFSFSERRLKKSPIKDVAGMMRSFHYAAYGSILLNDNYRKKDIATLEYWAEQWQHYVNRFYLTAYFERIGMPYTEGVQTLVQVYLLEKAIYELGYELNSRPHWVIIPLRGIKYLLDKVIKVDQ